MDGLLLEELTDEQLIIGIVVKCTWCLRLGCGFLIDEKFLGALNLLNDDRFMFIM